MRDFCGAQYLRPVYELGANGKYSRRTTCSTTNVLVRNGGFENDKVGLVCLFRQDKKMYIYDRSSMSQTV